VAWEDSRQQDKQAEETKRNPTQRIATLKIIPSCFAGGNAAGGMMLDWDVYEAARNNDERCGRQEEKPSKSH
jgi:hypothetical protein